MTAICVKTHRKPTGMVLVVEDEPSLRRLLREGLTDEGYGVYTAENAHEALRALEEDQADIVLLDLMLPGMGGLELASQIRKRWPICIVAMSASPALLDRAEHHPCVDGSVAKPFDWDNLIDELEKMSLN